MRTLSDMNKRYHILCSLIFAGILLIAGLALSADNLKLKNYAKGEVCLNCHETLKETLKSPFMHPLFKNGECSGCHNPHTSPYNKLLLSNVNELCLSCHKKLLPEKARSTHKVVVEGNCTSCHSPHASSNRFVLAKAGNDLCFDCHKDVGTNVKEAKFKHEPVEKGKGCLNCHNPHASETSDFILKNSVPSLCIECHKPGTPAFLQQHMNYPVAGSNCSSCHDTHGSNKKKIIYDNVHAPVAEKKCTECHDRPDSSNPLRTKTDGVELCMGCHKDTIKDMFSKNRLHWPLADKKGCLNCHSAHAGSQKGLIDNSIIDVCGKCHADTVELQSITRNNPDNTGLCKPIKEENCIACHSPHASDNILLSPEPSMGFGTCNTCHEWQSHKTHPIGEKIIDSRNKNLSMDCLTCHKACGTGNKPLMMHFDTVYALCIQCHEDYKR